jgi:CheY-like chemotaxis protein
LAPHDNSGDETLALRSQPISRAAVAFYQLHATIHNIAAECERLLERASRPERRGWREALGDAWLGSRQVLLLLEHWMSSHELTEAERLRRFVEQMDEPLERVRQGLGTLLRFVPIEPLDELFLQDARAVFESALEVSAWDGRARLPSHGPLRTTAARPDVPGGRARVLVVDDDDIQRSGLSRLLNALGYDALTAANGVEALAVANGQSVDLVLTDIGMPQMDGFELLARLKREEATSHVPVIVVSGMDDIQSVVRCIEQGAEDHITKPFEMVLLQARIRAALERKRSRDVDLARLRRVAQLSAAAEAVEGDRYEPGMLQDLIAHEDELGRLARVFDHMVGSLRLREDQLQHRLRELQREIRQSRVVARVPGADEAADEHAFQPGEVVADRYEILGTLGTGGMGMVYLARDRELDEEIAMKVVRRDLMHRDTTLAERLKSEIRLARKISHRNVVRAHDWGEWRGIYFITMEHVKGISIGELLDNRPRLTIESTIAVGLQLLEALAVAHEQGIIHRDIKPTNLLLDDEGLLKVLDFGIARMATGPGPAHTVGGGMVGTPQYMAPEQLLGGTVDARTDLFAAGAVLYECAAGTPAFEGDSPFAVIARILEGPPRPLVQFVPHAPPPFLALVDRMLKRSAAERPASARAALEELNQVGYVIKSTAT